MEKYQHAPENLIDFYCYILFIHGWCGYKVWYFIILVKLIKYVGSTVRYMYSI